MRVQQARDRAQEMIVEAKQFKAAVNLPKGIIDNPFYKEGGGIPDDDEFFHITCHIEPTLKAKIERGEYVELEKLLPKIKNSAREEVA